MTIAQRRRIVGLMLVTLTAGTGAVVASWALAKKPTLGSVFREIDLLNGEAYDLRSARQ